MHLLHWIAPGSEPPSPWLVFYTLRVLFFLVSFVLGRFYSQPANDRKNFYCCGDRGYVSGDVGALIPQERTGHSRNLLRPHDLDGSVFYFSPVAM